MTDSANNWPAHAAAYNTHHQMFNMISKHIKNIHGVTICDVPCGAGMFSQRLAEIGMEVTALDIEAVEPYAVMAGNPAKKIKWRFDEPTRQSLLESKWWEWPENEVVMVLDKMCSSDLSDFIAYSKSRSMKK